MSSESIKKSLKEHYADFESVSGKLSEVVRNLGFAGIGLIWIFRNDERDIVNLIPDELDLPLLFIVISLALDLFQLTWKSVFLGVFHFIRERQIDKGTRPATDAEDVHLPIVMPLITWLLFVLKILAMIIAYINFYPFFYGRI